MIGAIAGDIIGSVFERHQIKSTEFELFSSNSTFTDDTVLTVATAYAILNKVDYGNAFKEIGRRYPHCGYGGSFYLWLFSSDSKPYNSWGNGAAMRVSPIGFAFDSVDTVLEEAQRSAEVTHNHPEGIKGAQATALSIFLARTGLEKDQIKHEIITRFNYDLDRSLDEIRPYYTFDVSCQGSVPEAIIAFLESRNYEDAIRKAISLGGDSDTIACVAGGIAHAYYQEIPDIIRTNVHEILPQDLQKITAEFCKRYGLE